MTTTQMIDTLQNTLNYLQRCKINKQNPTQTYEKLKSVIIFFNNKNTNGEKTIDDLRANMPPGFDALLGRK